MASNKVNLGIGNATGMFYTATAGTTLPTTPAATLTGWTEVGAIDENGITWSPSKDSEPIRNWAKVIERLAAATEGGTVKGNLLYTDKKTLETIFGADNVTYTAADSTHGNITKVTVAPGVSAPACAFLFIMKDGDDMIMIGTSSGVVRDLDDITFAPGDAIVYGVTIESDSWTFAKDDGQITS